MNASHGSAVSGEDNRTAATKADIVVIAEICAYVYSPLVFRWNVSIERDEYFNCR